MESHLVPEGPVYGQTLVPNHDTFATPLFRIVRFSSIHRLQLGFVTVFIASTKLSYFTTLNAMPCIGLYVM